VSRSVPSVKGDAARTLFNVKCDNITWAVLDSGIDGDHPVFKDKNNKPRIKKAYDFSNIRKIVSLDNLQTDTAFETRLDELMMQRKEKLPNAPELPREEAKEHLKKLADDAQRRRPIHWELVEKFIEVDPKTPPKSVHGTHVAGIIGGYAKPDDDNGFASGMAPDINFYDFRVLAKTLEDTEFAIIAALQFLRYLNERNTYLTIHGANLSLSIPHDVRNFACGRTPICVECERLVENGVVVVAAAGNLGYQRFETKDGSYEGYTAFSITDPGNADGVITVGATHRFKPHTYGVSFFSSRGPTGDGRLKPDLVAPGERIESSLPKGEWGELDGTSMAAPHVSGAAAMLMARYDELIGEPRRIKQILCESATDLGRERSFQGHGMLDVLRAFQSI
jgi:subtilisin family serine protease